MWKNNFVKEFSENILPLYMKHEETFDEKRIHGCLHISRSLIFSEFMARYYYDSGADVDFDAIRYAVAFHDAGRQDNGIDFWEKDSADLCFSYMLQKHSEKYSRYCGNLIIKELDNYDINKQIVTDADVLDIMRPVCGHGGIFGFLPERLSFMKDDSQIRKDLIHDAWKLIKYTEENQHIFNGKKTLYRILETLDQYEYKLLYELK
jgi:hypothetical protein